MTNTPAHLVARALRDRRTVTWQYTTAPSGYWQFHGRTRSQILREVRDTPAGQFNYGITYDASRPNTTGRYGLEAYATTKC